MLLLPEDPDASARGIRAALGERFGVRVAVVVTDTAGRPWRDGLVDIAIGAAGLAVVDDLRGGRDAHGRELGVACEPAAIDETALERMNDGIAIDPWTSFPNWDGRPADYDHIIQVLAAHLATDPPRPAAWSA